MAKNADILLFIFYFMANIVFYVIINITIIIIAIIINVAIDVLLCSLYLLILYATIREREN